MIDILPAAKWDHLAFVVSRAHVQTIRDAAVAALSGDDGPLVALQRELPSR